ncbi:MAG: tyrosyl-tRNA synthetase [Claussenomyces sp. TS43310]|nr:MAG: tyrosyl-tRNA synthetase [Claussenomyces sp. TS43310]
MYHGKTCRRMVGTKWLAKKADAEKDWQQRAQEINAGKRKSMLRILEERGLVHQIAGDRDTLDELMTSKRVGAYVGIDPTASSLHAGHLLPLMCLFWMYVHGYHTVSLLGGATAKIGDPTDRLVSREKQVASIRTANMVAMHYQLKKLWINVEAYGRNFGYVHDWAWHRELVNNNAWMNKLSIMEVLQVLGSGMRMGTMLAKDTVKNKLEKGDGMSFAEFSYPLLQGWDWWHMYNTKGIQMQIGGSDQYGNIIAGIDAVKYISRHHPAPEVREGKDLPSAAPFGFTVPLLTTSSGEKFGKSAGNAIWLDKSQFSTFDLYGFFMRQADSDVERYLKLFTFLPLEHIHTLVEEHMAAPSQRKAQHVLARHFVELVHGIEEAKDAETRHRMLFGKPSALSSMDPSAISPPEEDTSKSYGPKSAKEVRNEKPLPVLLNNAPTPNMKLPHHLIHTKSIGRILHAAGLAESASDGHRLVTKQGGVYIGGLPGQKAPMSDAALSFTPIKLWKPEDTSKYLVGGNLLILRKGKHNIRIVEVVGDEEWRRSGVKYPGEASAFQGNRE